MPNVASLRARLPLIVNTPEWTCCGDKGIRILEAVGESQWALRAVCLTCNRRLIIRKRGVTIEVDSKII